MEQVPARILVVDDDANNREILCRRLARRGFNVESAVNGFDALGLIAGSTFDLVLLDVEMPGMSGFDVLRRVRLDKSPAQLPVIIATARHDREDVLHALTLGANDYVTKPLDFAVVLARTETQLAQKRAMERIVALESDLRRQNVELDQSNRRMKHSLGLAAKIQRSLLPAEPAQVPGLKFAWIYEPCDELGGDILNFFPVGPRHVAIYLLDVSGHGVPAALMSVTLDRMLAPIPGQPSLVQQNGKTGLEPRSPKDVAEELNRRFQMYGWEGQYFTLFYGVLDFVTGQMRYVSCGHPPGLVLSAGLEPRFLDRHNLALGWFPDAEFDEGSLDLREGDRFFVYSDGITETMDRERSLFGRERLARLCADARDRDLETTMTRLQQQLNEYRDGSQANDDVSSLALELVPKPPELPVI